MLVREGWSTEFARQKFDVELSEIDLERMMVERGRPPEDVRRLTAPEAFRLLQNEAESFSTWAAGLHGAMDEVKARAAGQVLRENRDKMFAKVLERLDSERAG